MRLLFVADGHSPIALNWMAYFVEAGHEVHVISTFPAAPSLNVASWTEVPIAFSGAARFGAGTGKRDTGASNRGVRPPSALRSLGGARSLRLRVFLRHWLGPLTVPAAARRARAVIASVQPDLVHALRIPFEGMLAAATQPEAPLLLSVWGNDFTFHAPSAPGMARLTRRALRRADALHADCQRDLRLARHWGLPEGRPEIVLPGNGGVRPEVFHPRSQPGESVGSALGAALGSIPPQASVVINPRGFRAYVRLDTFFRMIPLVLAQHPAARFLCPAMAADALAEGWLRRLGIRDSVHLLPRLTPQEMAAAFRRADVAVSASIHDGTPNTLLEAMACGCVPVAGDIESIREWIEDGVNGLLTDPANPADLAAAVSRLLSDPGLREQAAAHNARLIAERALHPEVMQQAEAFYHRLVG